MAAASLTPSPVEVFIPLMEQNRSAVRKKAIFTLGKDFGPFHITPAFTELYAAQFLPSTSHHVVNSLLRNSIITSLNGPSATIMQKSSILLIAAITRTSPQLITPVLSDLLPGILKATSREDEEEKETSVQARLLFPYFLQNNYLTIFT